MSSDAPKPTDETTELRSRVQALEEALVALATATQNWKGGSCEGVAYSNATWRSDVMAAVARYAKR